MIPVLLMMIPAMVINENLTLYPLVSSEAGQGWKVELFELAEPIPAHYHKIQRQFVVVTEGELQVFCENNGPVVLRSGERVQIDPGVVHAITPKGRAQFVAIDFPGLTFPEDVFYDRPTTPIQWTPTFTEWVPTLDEKYFGSKIDAGVYAVYNIVNGSVTGGKWSAALLEIQDSPKHFHRIEREQFIVVHGTLDIEIDGLHHIVEAGEAVTIEPERIHKLTSAHTSPVRVLCFNFPAFDPADMYCIE